MKACLALAAVALSLLAAPAAAEDPTAAAAAATPAPLRVRSRAMIGGGGLLTGMGGFALLVATPFTISAATCTRCSEHDVSLWPMMIAGGVMVAAGIPLLVVGAQKVPAVDKAQPKPTLLLGPTGAALRVQF